MDSDSSMEQDSGATLGVQGRVQLSERVASVPMEASEASKSSTPITTPAVVTGGPAALSEDRTMHLASTLPLPEEEEASSKGSPTISEADSEEGITAGLRTQIREERRDSTRQSEMADMMEMLSNIMEVVQKNRTRLLETEATEHRLAAMEKQLLRMRDDAKETSPKQSHPDTGEGAKEDVLAEEAKEDEPPVVSNSDIFVLV